MKIREECPGEKVCTTDSEIGVCATRKLELSEICHNRTGGCRLYFTKRGSTPKQYEALLESAMRITEEHLSNFTINEKKLYLFEKEAKIIYDRAERIVNAQKDEERDNESKNDKGQPGRGFTKGSSDAFNFTPEQIREMYLARQRKAEKRNKKRSK